MSTDSKRALENWRSFIGKYGSTTWYLIERDGFDEETIIATWDIELENWLWRISECPVCNEESE